MRWWRSLRLWIHQRQPMWQGEVVGFETFDDDRYVVSIQVQSETPIPPESLGWCHVIAYPARGPAGG
jgi:hypothetical protein